MCEARQFAKEGMVPFLAEIRFPVNARGFIWSMNPVCQFDNLRACSCFVR